ncbi:unnamed protein product [Arabis nemorensis]|uniref:Uncharacterized protein n=1 Tax=Arabis nemorensis TaxID=586526 RepID=A0A565BPY1_9BRAS|nr:unnamed protein product [Arabis nemorensis]
MGALFETHIKKESDSTFINRLPPWRSEDNFIANESGRILVFWDPSLSVVIYHKSDQMIMCGVFVPQLQHYFTVSFIYAFNCHLLWQELADLRGSSPTSSRPWILAGDLTKSLVNTSTRQFPKLSPLLPACRRCEVV